jgi:hypothetical protein
MVPIRAEQKPRAIRTFDLITAEGRVHHFPKPTWFACMTLQALKEPLILSVVILGLIYTAAVPAGPIESLAIDGCTDRDISRTSMLLWARTFAS